MNIIKIQDQLKGVPDQTLIGYVQNPTGQVPTYLALSELQRRKEMRQNYQANKPEQKTVAEELVQESQPGIAALPEGQPMQQAMQPPPEMSAQQMAQGGVAELDTGDMYDEKNYATGGIVAFDEGGDVKHYAYGDLVTKTDPNKYDPDWYQNATAALVKPRTGMALDDYIMQTQAAQQAFGVDPEFYKKILEESKAERTKELESAKNMDAAQLLLTYGSALAGTPGFGKALGVAGEKAAPIVSAMGKTQREINNMYKMADRKTLEAQYAQARGDAAGAQKAIDERDNINTQIEIKNAENETKMREAQVKANAEGKGKFYDMYNTAKDNALNNMKTTYPDGIHNERFNGDKTKWSAELLEETKSELINLGAQKGYDKAQVASMFPEVFGPISKPATENQPAPAPSPAPKASYPQPTKADIDYINAHPEKKDWFKAHFGINPPSLVDQIPR